MQFTLDPHALEDLQYFAKHDAKKLKRIFALFEDILRHPREGIGKPEALKYSLQGCYSRRIDREHRIVYQIQSDMIIILSCRFHYS
jgi:toxin YoeB